MTPLRVMLCDDSAVVRGALSRVLEADPAIRIVARAGNGVDNIDMEGATKRGIIVVNTPESNIVSVRSLV